MFRNSKQITIFPLLALALLLTACSSAGGDSLFQKEDDGILIFASFQPFGVDSDVKQAIDDFNSTHTDVQIEIRDYWGETYEDGRQGRQRLLTEIGSGKMPDILDLGYNCGDIKMLPYRRMAMWGYLEDLWPYIENDPDLELIEAPLKAAEVDGKLYMAFDSVAVKTLLGPESLVGDRYTWTLGDLMAAYSSMPEDSTIFEFFYDRSQVFTDLLGMSLDSYVDWETGQCLFDCEDFRTALEFCKNFPAGESISPEELEMDDEFYRKMAEDTEKLTRLMSSGRQMLIHGIGPFHYVQVYDGVFEEPVSFIGYPVGDGSVGSAFYASECKLAMSSNCKNKDAAWEIIRQLLLPKYTSKADVAQDPRFPSASRIPISLADYDKVKQAYMSDALKDEMVFVYGRPVKLHPVTEGEIRRYEDFFNSIEKIDLYDDDLLNIVQECAEPYFLGDKTLDETIAIIQNRTALYVNEIR